MSNGKVISKSHCHRHGLCVTKVWHRSICTPFDNILLNTPVTSTGEPPSFDCLTAPASRTHLAAAIARSISHCSHIESPVQYRVTCYRRSRRPKRGAFSTHRLRGRMRSAPRERQCALHLHFLYAHLGPYLFITRVSYKNARRIRVSYTRNKIL